MKKTYIISAVISVAILLPLLLTASQERKKIIGGMCEYRLYSGNIRVSSIKKTERSKLQTRMHGGPEYEGYEIAYSFIPDETIEEELAKRWIEEKQIFRFFNSWFPSDKYLIIHDIEVGGVYPAEIMVIKKGTCTPVIIEVEDWERNIDY